MQDSLGPQANVKRRERAVGQDRRLSEKGELYLDSDSGGMVSDSLVSRTMSTSLAAEGVTALMPGRLMSRPSPASNCPALHCPSACATHTRWRATLNDPFFVIS